MDQEELSLSNFTILNPISLSWKFHQQFPTPRTNTTYNFKEVGEKGKQEPKCLFDIKTW
jgi:hypothetical protein